MKRIRIPIICSLALLLVLGSVGLLAAPQDELYPEKTVIPRLMQQGQNGYAIFLDSGLKEKLTQLDAFIQHKESLGFKVTVVTEKDWGGGTQNIAVLNVRKWLVNNYKQKKLLYVLFIANPSTDGTGNIPMAITPVAWTDWPYMDLDSNWDSLIPANSEKGKKKDMKDNVELITSINGQWDVLVGRIPWYGPESQFWKAADVDAVLARTIRYETDTRDTSWRFNWLWAEHGDGSVKMQTRYACDRIGADYVRLWSDFGDTAPSDGEPNHVAGVLNSRQESGQDPVGMVRYHSHGSGDSVCATIHTKTAVNLRDDYPAIHSFGACSVATPRNPNNVTGAIFRHNGIACIGPSMTVIAGSPARIKMDGGLENGKSIGEDFWTRSANVRSHGELGISGVNKTSLCYYLMGDPSVVPFKQRHGAPLQVAPYAAQYDKVIGGQNVADRSYTVTNNTKEAMTVQVATNVPWLTVSSDTLTVPAGNAQTFNVKVDPAHQAVRIGENQAVIALKSGDHQRNIDYRLDKHLPAQVLYNSMNRPVRGHRRGSQEKELGIALTKMDQGLIDGAILVDTPLSLDGRPRDLMVPGFNSFTLSFWVKDAGAATADATATAGLSKEALKALKKRERKDDKKIEKNTQPGIKRKIMSFGSAWTIATNENDQLTLDIVENKFLLPADHPDRLATKKSLKLELKESDDWSDYHVTGPEFTPGEWHHVALVVDRDGKDVAFWVDGKAYRSDQMFNFETALLSVAKTYVSFVGNKEARTAFDELRYFNYPLNADAIALLYGRQAPDHLVLPYFGDKRPPNEATLTWETAYPNIPRKLEYATQSDFSDAQWVNVSGKSEVTLDGLQDGQDYYWRVLTKYGNNIVKSSTGYFKTDATMELAAPRVVPKLNKKPPVFHIGVAGADLKLGKYVIDTPGDQLSYELISGPSWLTLTDAGIVFTPYGPKESQMGEHKLIFKVSDQTGLSVEHEAIIKAEYPKVPKKKDKA